VAPVQRGRAAGGDDRAANGFTPGKTSCQIQDRSSSPPWTPSGRHDPK